MTIKKMMKKIDLVKAIGKLFPNGINEKNDCVDPAHVVMAYIRDENTAVLIRAMVDEDTVTTASFKFKPVEESVAYNVEYLTEMLNVMRKAGCEYVLLRAGIHNGKEYPLLMVGTTEEHGDIIMAMSPQMREGPDPVLLRYKEYLDSLEPKPEPKQDNGFDIKPRTLEEHKEKVITREGP
jgi:hypothetical protein